MNREQRINIIAPALRGILAEDGRLPLVRVSESEQTEGAFVWAAKADASPESLVADLRNFLAVQTEKPSHLTVPGVGTFEILPHPGQSGRAAGKVVFVTGAAQGFGLQIAQSFASEGACVILADLNAEGAQKAADAINAETGTEVAVGSAINVTDSTSIAASLHDAVCRFGGIDVFVSNAGVLKAESVKTQPEKDFDFVTTVNYKGYFLCVQNVAPIMAILHTANPALRSDIIQINSKSGLVGSNRNGAYAGSKFGGIGLTQSFALELIEDGIKVNSICPGNFFDGPLWSEPENGLFAQYLRTGKVPEAKTIADVKKFYEAKVPMGRGCETKDVMCAAFYLIDQQYETGQAVPVTGGQVMQN